MNIDPKIQVLLDQQQYEKALPLLEKKLKGSPNRLEIFIAMGLCYYKLKEFGKSVEKYSLALALDPEQAELYSNRGLSYFMLRDKQASLQDFNKAQEIEPQNPYRYSSRAYIKDGFGDTDGAIEDYEIAIALDPEDAIAHNNLGMLLEKQGYKRKAEQNFSKADELDGMSFMQVKPALTSNGSNGAAQKPAENNATSGEIQKKKMTASHLGSVLRAVFTTRQGFQEFLQFLRGK